MGASVGADFQSWRWWTDGMPAHRLVHFAKSRGVSAPDAEAVIFEALYEEGENTSRAEVLARIAATKLGFDESEVLGFLGSGAGAQEVLDEMEAGQRIFGSVSSVPHFIVSSDASQQQYSFTGAHPTDQFLELFRKVCEE
mmetsp:Transcript_93102/g.259338  ORF Transcript_93102/g.259338 Transcript_93102/m.259338 type:complete len:140 (+) Transcript_93102:391-810(+)